MYKHNWSKVDPLRPTVQKNDEHKQNTQKVSSDVRRDDVQVTTAEYSPSAPKSWSIITYMCLR